MKIQQFENIINNIIKSVFNIDISILELENQSAKKWYDKKYKYVETLKENTIYGVYIKSDYNGMIEFDFKVGKIENVIKKFITTFSSKYKTTQFINGELVNLSKIQIYDKLKNYNKDRVFKEMFYTTLYGIGVFVLFGNPNIEAMTTYLKNNKVEYKTEYSEAGWVYRFVINKDISYHNELLSNFTI